MATTERERGAALGPAEIQMTCGQCGVEFIVPEALYNMRLADHHSFWCPLGHERHYPRGKTALEIEREQRQRTERLLQRERQTHDQTRADRDHKERQRRAAKGQVTRMKNRARAGLCPCCNRHFANLERHMASKHPGMMAEDAADQQ